MRLIKEIQDMAVLLVDTGFYSLDEIVSEVIDCFDDGQGLDENRIREMVSNFMQACLKESRAWDVTDCDKLDEAFAELDRHGIIARQNFACCQTCGYAEIETLFSANTIGYVFYHEQDTESAVRSQYLYLAYGSISGKESDSKRVAKSIVNTLKRHGLSVEWNGSISSRICVRDIQWQRRPMVWEIS